MTLESSCSCYDSYNARLKRPTSALLFTLFSERQEHLRLRQRASIISSRRDIVLTSLSFSYRVSHQKAGAKCEEMGATEVKTNVKEDNESERGKPHRASSRCESTKEAVVISLLSPACVGVRATR